MKHTITARRVRELLDYDPETGIFIWRRRPLRCGLERIDRGWNKRFAGKLAIGGRHPQGHFRICLYCRGYAAHRLAWLYVYGEWPKTDIDHINGNGGDNRIANLRLASVSQNIMNSKRHRDNTSGTKGISLDKRSGRWHVYVTVKYKRVFSKLYNDLDDAIAARHEAAKKHHGEFARAA